MKFYCDNCQTKYSIADEKVRGKVLKIRCKKCDHVITVREPKDLAANRKRAASAGGRKQVSGGGTSSAASQKAPAPPGPPPTPDQVEWYYSVNGQSYGPLNKSDLDEKLATGELGDATYVWNESYSDWKRVKSVDAFSKALQKGRQVRKPAKTHGVSQTLEAIDREDAEAARQSDSRAGASTGEPEPSGGRVDESSSPVADRRDDAAAAGASGTATADDGQEDRLEDLRRRLDLGEEADGGSPPDKADSPAFEPEPDVSEEPTESAQSEPIDPFEPDGPAPETEVERPGKREAPEQKQRTEKPESQRQPETPESEPGRRTYDLQEDSDLPELGADEPASTDVGDEPAPTEPAGEAAPTELMENPAPEPTAGTEKAGDDIGGVGTHDGLFSHVDGRDGPSPEADAAGGLAADDAEEDGEEDADDAVPFFPSAPKLGDSEDDTRASSRVDQMTESLLIQLNEVKKGGKKRVVIGVLGILATLGGMTAMVYFGVTKFGGNDLVVEEEDGPSAGNVGARPEFQEYSPEELARVSDRFVVDEPLEITREDSRAAYEREEAAGSEGSGGSGGSGGAQGGDGDADGQMPSVDPDRFRFEASEEDREADRADRPEPEESGSRFGRPEIAGAGGSDDDSSGAVAEAGGGESDDEANSRFEAMGAVQSDRQREVYSGDGDVPVNREIQEGLTGAQIGDGIGRIMESVGSCRERHIFRGGTLEVEEIWVSVNVLPSGEIGHFEMTPDSLDGTDFRTCMESHTGRWRFPRFRGDPVEIEAPFALR